MWAKPLLDGSVAAVLLARRCGLACDCYGPCSDSKVVDAQFGFERAVGALVANLAGKDRAALSRIKHLVRTGLRGPLRDGLAMETESTLEHLAGQQAGAGIARFRGSP